MCAFLVATYTDGQPPESAAWFCKWLEEAANDFRFGKTYLKGMRYAVFGLGNSVYLSHFNTVGIFSSGHLFKMCVLHLPPPRCPPRPNPHIFKGIRPKVKFRYINILFTALSLRKPVKFLNSSLCLLITPVPRRKCFIL